MSFYAGTLGELVIVEVFVFYIWFKVLLETMREKGSVETRALATSYNKLLLTSIGLVLNSLAIGGIMLFRVVQLINGQWPFIWAIVAFYVILAISNFMFILSASIGTNMRLLKVFMVVTTIWTLFVIFGGITWLVDQAHLGKVVV